VLVGGSSRHHSFTEGDAARFGESLEALARSGVALMGTLSRRSDPALRARVERCFREAGGFLWDGTGENPYLALLALADAVVVTADSYNMAGEAAATGAPVLVFEPSGGHPKLDAFLDGLRAKGIVHPFRGRLEGERYEPLNSTLQIAEAVRRGLARHRARLAAG
jgi:mitochondrial fission protein ELM1